MHLSSSPPFSVFPHSVLSPNLDSEIQRQSTHGIDSSCLADGRIQWKLMERSGNESGFKLLAEYDMAKERDTRTFVYVASRFLIIESRSTLLLSNHANRARHTCLTDPTLTATPPSSLPCPIKSFSLFRRRSLAPSLVSF